MKFGPVALVEAEGAILAHSLNLGPHRLGKGRVLTKADITALGQAGLRRVTVARLSADDLGENTAATLLGAAGAGAGMTPSKAFAGRVNLVAGCGGVLAVSTPAVNAVNRVDPAITLATLPAFSRVDKGQLLATIKIIPYGVNAALTRRAAHEMAAALSLHPVQQQRVSLILTTVPGMKPSLLNKGQRAIKARLVRLGLSLHQCTNTPHETTALATAITAATGDIILLLTASATSDPGDVGPAALVQAGGTVQRFGIPVDPGNLLFIGSLNGRPVLGLPGCVRAPALNGADWVLERLVCGIKITNEMLTGMGVGGLLKEIPTRPQPRRLKAQPASRKVAVILLAAGRSRRMGGADKLLEMIDGQAMLTHAAQAALASTAAQVFVALPPQADARRARLAGLAVRPIEAPDFVEGMGASLRNAMAHISDDYEAVIVALADMPDITPTHFNALIAAYDPAQNREICRATDADGTPGHPVLLGRRFFETLATASGDSGARDILRTSPEFVFNVKTKGNAATLDLDTPQAWAHWRKSR